MTRELLPFPCWLALERQKRQATPTWKGLKPRRGKARGRDVCIFSGGRYDKEFVQVMRSTDSSSKRIVCSVLFLDQERLERWTSSSCFARRDSSVSVTAGFLSATRPASSSSLVLSRLGRPWKTVEAD